MEELVFLKSRLWRWDGRVRRESEGETGAHLKDKWKFTVALCHVRHQVSRKSSSYLMLGYPHTPSYTHD